MRTLAILLLLAPLRGFAADATPDTAVPAPKKPAVKRTAKPVTKPAATAVATSATPTTTTAPVAAAPAPSATPASATPPPWMKPAVSATAAETAAVAPATAPAGVEVPAAGAGLTVTPIEDLPEAPPIFTPMYGFTWSEGLNMSNAGNFFFGSNIDSTMGGRWALPNDQAIFAVYELAYNGPALRAQEGHEFAERTLDHSIGIGHQWRVNPTYKVFSRVSFLDEYRRSGSSELFGHGLYDFYTPAVSVDQQLDLGHDLVGGFGISYADVIFPNYTDLLTEFQQANATSEKAGGQYDYQQVRVGPTLKIGKTGSAWVAVSLQSYAKAKVIEKTGTAGTEAQSDVNEEAGATWTFGKTGTLNDLSTDLSLTLKAKQSNQNFLHFKYFGDTAPDFIHHNYDFWSLDLLAPGRWWFDESRQLFLQPEWVFTNYTSRPPRTAAGLYKTDKKEYDSSFLLTLGYRKPIYRLGTLTTGYMLQVQQSNNHFERFLPYNYTGHMFFTSVNIAY